MDRHLHHMSGGLDIRHSPAGTAWVFADNLRRLLHSSAARAEAVQYSTNATICAERYAGDEHWNRTEAKQNRRAPVALNRP